MSLFISIVVTLICIFWPGVIIMSPMIIAAKDFSSSKSFIISAMLMFIYPVFIFLLLKLTGFQFYGTDPLNWAIIVLSAGTLVSLAYNLPGQLSNLYRGISNEGYHIGKKHVYYNGIIIKNADPDTFVQYNNIPNSDDCYSTSLHACYSKDKNHVYYENKKLPDADVATFGPLAKDNSLNYWHDKKHAYYKWYRIDEADGATFRYLAPLYTCDKTQVFYENKVVTGADPVTFQVMDGHIGCDAQRVFVQALHADNIQDLESFETVMLNNEVFARDKKHVYVPRYALPHPLLPFPGADPESFEVIGNYYAKDQNRVYYYSYHIEQIVVLEEANPATFRLEYDHEKNTDATDGRKYYTSGSLYTE